MWPTDITKFPYLCRTSRILGYARRAEVVQAAYRAARKRRRHSAGVDGQDRESFDLAWAEERSRIPEELEAGAYAWQPFLRCRIEPVGAKARDVYVPTRRDATASGMLMRALYHLHVERVLHDSASAYRLKRGPRLAVEHVFRRASESLPWFLGLDIKSYFPSIDLEMALRDLDVLTGDPAVVHYVRERFTTGAVSDGVLVPFTGVAPGDPLAGLMANLFLAAEDRQIAARVPVYVRYCDDLCMLLRSKGEAEDALTLATDLLGRRGLMVKPESVRIVDLREGRAEMLGLEFDLETPWVSVSRVARLRQRLEAVAERYDMRPDVGARKAADLLRGTLEYARGARNLEVVYDLVRRAGQVFPGGNWRAVLRRSR